MSAGPQVTRALATLGGEVAIWDLQTATTFTRRPKQEIDKPTAALSLDDRVTLGQ